jgi:hypothetical protein
MPEPRRVRLVLVRGDERPLGVTPRLDVPIPWWQEAWPVVDAARERFGLDVTILRLLECGDGEVHGGDVTYLAEVGAGVDVTALPLEPWTGPTPLPDDPLRMPWARPGGPAIDLAWATSVLTASGLPLAGAPRQIRTWNLSSLWTLPLDDGTAAWLKAVPPFFAREGAVLEHLAGRSVPSLLGHDGYRALMPELPGEDQYDAARPILDRMIDALVDIQADETTRVDELLGLGLPDWRGPALTVAIQGLVARRAGELSAADRAALEAFADGLPARFVAIDACDLPDTLVHGDFHPGNVRAEGERVTLLDWGDCGVGQPLLDEPAFLHGRPALADGLRTHWHARWRERVPGSDPDRASRLLEPVAAARQALIYQRVLDGIEATEQPYHRPDVPAWLRITADRVRAETGSAT